MELEPESGQRYMLEQPLPYPRQSAIPEVIILQNLRVFRPLLLPHEAMIPDGCIVKYTSAGVSF
jgi:hypothetical protein